MKTQYLVTFGIWAIYLALLLVPAAADAQVVAPVGADFQINSYTTYGQRDPDIAFLANGTFVVVWGGTYTLGDSYYGVTTRIFQSDGTPLTTEIQVADNPSNAQENPIVGAGSSGDFVVIWEEETGVFQPQGQRFGSNGAFIGSNFQIDDNTTARGIRPRLAFLENGEFLVVWQSYGSPGDDPDSAIVGRAFHSDGSPNGNSFQINDQTSGEQIEPAISTDGSGGFVVVWQNADSIAAKGLGSDGLPVGSEMTVNSNTSGSHQEPSISFAPDGSFAVVWTATTSEGTDTLSDSIQGRRFTSDGIPINDDFQVNSYTTGDQRHPAVVHVGEGFVTFFRSDGTVFRRHFDSNALPLEDDFRLETTEPAALNFPAISTNSSGDFVVTFNYESTEAFSEYTVRAQRYTLNGGVGDRVWLDDNSNGIQDDGESGIEGVTLELLRPSGEVLDKTETSADGGYSFEALAGTYLVRCTLPAGLAFTVQGAGSDDDSDFDPATGLTSLLIVNAGFVSSDLDAGLEPAVIGNRVWVDADRDGMQDAGESGFPGAIVRLLDEVGAEITSTETDGDGLYAFAGLGTASYQITVDLPTGHSFSPMDSALDHADSDVNPSTGETEIFGYVAGQASRAWDVGIYETPLFANGFASGDITAWSSSVP